LCISKAHASGLTKIASWPTLQSRRHLKCREARGGHRQATGGSEATTCLTLNFRTSQPQLLPLTKVRASSKQGDQIWWCTRRRREAEVSRNALALLGKQLSMTPVTPLPCSSLLACQCFIHDSYGFYHFASMTHEESFCGSRSVAWDASCSNA